MSPWTKPGVCDLCGKPFDDHKLPTVGMAAIKPMCPPPTPYYGKAK